MKVIKGGVTAAKGFYAAGAAAAIKYQNRKDMALVLSEKVCNIAGTFTSNVVKAAPVLWDKNIVENRRTAQAVIVNAGIANACTGKLGMEYCEKTAKAAAEVFHINEKDVLVCSTGEIGAQLPIDRIVAGLPLLDAAKGCDCEHGTLAAEAIMTTDTVSKQIAVSFEIDGVTVSLGGMSKGSGMIHPNMCTMLGFLTTDIDIDVDLMQEALREDIIDTFNMISVDGDTSTNDTLLLFANGMAGNRKITKKDENYAKFVEALRYVNTFLARRMAGDGEGATALIETAVINAATKEDARKLAKSVVCSSLVKAAVYGHDANWGRIACALGYSGVPFDPEQMDIWFVGKNEKLKVCQDGITTGYSEEKASELLSEPEVGFLVDVKSGKEEATAWGCNLTYDYVKINADYRS